MYRMENLDKFSALAKIAPEAMSSSLPASAMRRSMRTSSRAMVG